MFIAALLNNSQYVDIAKMSTNRLKNKESVVFFSAVERKEMLSLSTWVIIDGGMLNKVSQTEKEILCGLTYT